MSDLFDEASPFRRILADSGQSLAPDSPSVRSWFELQAQRREATGPVAAEAPQVLVIDAEGPDECGFGHTRETYAPIVVDVHGGVARIRVSKLPRNARCLILILDDPIFEQIQKYVVGHESSLGKEDLLKLLFREDLEGVKFHRYRILTSARPLESWANDAGELAVDIPLPSALANWGRGTTVVVFFEQSGERGGRGRQKPADQGGLFGADQ